MSDRIFRSSRSFVSLFAVILAMLSLGSCAGTTIPSNPTADSTPTPDSAPTPDSVEPPTDMVQTDSIGPCVGSCVDKQCGDDGCGGSCGVCGGSAVCVEGSCCAPACDGKTCGDDGCGSVCGECVGAELCLDGNCCAQACDDKVCGDDGCGGDCGACGADELCLDGSCCAPACDGKSCGDDGCGGFCGECGSDELCVEGSCCTPACDDKFCGDDGCGGDCGVCDAESEYCDEGSCEAFLNNWQLCTANEQCPSESCVLCDSSNGNQFCAKPAGTVPSIPEAGVSNTCRLDQECASGACDIIKTVDSSAGGLCFATPGQCGQCNDDEDCAPQFYCSTSGPSAGDCMTKQSTGSPCLEDSWCVSGSCDQGTNTCQ